MPLSSLAVKTLPTSYTVTGGTSLPLSLLKNDFDSVILFPTADTVLASRRSIDTGFVAPRAVGESSPDGYTQARSKTYVKVPKLLANLKYTTNTSNIVHAFSVESTDAEKLAQLDLVAQILIDPAYRAAVLKGSAA